MQFSQFKILKKNIEQLVIYWLINISDEIKLIKKSLKIINKSVQVSTLYKYLLLSSYIPSLVLVL